MELESKLSNTDENGLTNGRFHPGGEQNGESKQFPKAPARALLSGHRGPITSVAIHPKYRYVVNCYLFFSSHVSSVNVPITVEI